jgi:CRP/FNR family cyclic AMP-dependent transcriptional regulator
MSLIDGLGRSATVTSGPDGVTAFRLSPAAFTDLMDQHPHTALLLLKGLVARVRQLEDQAGRTAG